MDGDSENAIESRQHLDAMLLVQMQQNLRVGARPEAMPRRLEFSSKLAVVVDLSVVYEREAARCPASSLVGVGHHGLTSRFREIDNRQASMAERSGRRTRRLQPRDPLAIGPAMGHRGRHLID